ncbi:MAG: hypothetical protein HKL80_05080 [Acidimicrobiales bacterium]|nr:hypothetical protein [Acidimicrobiales bacterium]
MRYWSADWHLGHQNIIKYCRRPFGSVGEMNDAILSQCYETLLPDDELWILGDVAMGDIGENLGLIKSINAHLVLVAGNHDRCFDTSRGDHQRWVDKYMEVGFSEIHVGAVEVEIGGVKALACHFPYFGDSRETDRLTQFRPTNLGLPLLHGHVHEKWRVSAGQINVGLDAWKGKLVEEETLAQLLRDKVQDLEIISW